MAKKFRTPAIIQDYDEASIKRKHIEYYYRCSNNYGAIVRIAKDRQDKKFCWDLEVVYFTSSNGCRNYISACDVPVDNIHFGLTDYIVGELIDEIESWM